jgi:uncharacterized protein
MIAAMVVDRRLASDLTAALGRFPVVTLLGPRQVGKTTLALQVARTWPTRVVHLDLERPSHAARLRDAELYLEANTDALVVIDEVQRMPQLFALLRALVDASRRPGRFLLLGSSSPDLVRGISESLAGRVKTLELQPFTLDEVGPTQENVRRLWSRGGFPESFLAPSDRASRAWRDAFLRTFVERDLQLMGFTLPSERVRRMLLMVAHRHGQLWNAADVARGLDVSPPTVARYADVLVGTFLLRRLEPLHANLGKRLVKSPKLYLRDSGLLHALLGIPDWNALQGHPIVGFSWEGFAIEHVLATRPGADVSFYRTATGAELDLVVQDAAGQREGFEMKLGADPRPPRGFWNAVDDLTLHSVTVLHAGEGRWPLREGVEARALLNLASA